MLEICESVFWWGLGWEAQDRPIKGICYWTLPEALASRPRMGGQINNVVWFGAKFGDRYATDKTSNVCSSVGHPTHVARDKQQYCNYYSLYFMVDVAPNTVSILRWKFSSLNRMSELSIYMFFDVASVDFWYCNCYLSMLRLTVRRNFFDLMSGHCQTRAHGIAHVAHLS